ncbi:hypothetical protein PGIGA_G00010550 [Pangasianodon gigas]|uniref:Uncharacterized protein n=1 Tax=Pangasianodon gigas TaxID=30993 RepID=A0ACC5W6X7_PANGG|nr:hypothetical protein [Pangasianodon gigas]
MQWAPKGMILAGCGQLLRKCFLTGQELSLRPDICSISSQIAVQFGYKSPLLIHMQLKRIHRDLVLNHSR